MTVHGWRSMTWRQRWCGLRHNHDRVLAFVARGEGIPPRLVARCTSCQHDTPGITPAARPPLQRFTGDGRRHVLVPCRLVIRKSA